MIKLEKNLRSLLLLIHPLLKEYKNYAYINKIIKRLNKRMMKVIQIILKNVKNSI